MPAPYSRLALLLALAGLSGGCAAITEGTTQSIQVITTPVSGATCKVENDKGTWSVPSTPGSVEVRKNSGSLSVTCQHPEAGEGRARLDSSLAAMTFGNVLVGGIIGVVVDTSTGAAYYYPDTITVALARSDAVGTSPASPAAPATATASPPPSTTALMTPEEADRHLKELSAAPPKPAGKDAPVAVELAFWDSVKDSNDPALYEAYLQQYPHGNFAALARVKFKQLATASRPAPAGGALKPAVLRQPAAPNPPLGATGPVTRFGDNVAFACPKPGTTVEFSDGGTLIFASANGFQCFYATKPGGDLLSSTVLGNFRSDSQRNLEQLWPLAIGKHAEFAFQTRPGASFTRAEFKVIGHETISVKAGSFDTFIIESHRMTTTGQSYDQYSETITYWFAPALGYPVKVAQRTDSGAYAAASNHEAVKVVLP